VTIRRRYAAISAVAAGALLMAGCGSAGGGGKASPTAEKLADSITIGLELAPDGYNSYTAATNSAYDQYIDNLTQRQFAQVQPDATIKADKAFGTYKKVSDDPLTVKYTFAKDAVWSDGVPLDFDDVLLAWASSSGNYPSGQTDPAGNPVDIFNTASTNGWAEIEKPQGKAGDKSFTLVYKSPYADWETVADYFMPAHIAAEQGGMSSANNGAELIKAIEDDDIAALKPVAKFWNEGWLYQENLPSLPDPKLIPTIGPYKYDNASNGTLTLVRNDKWWGPKAKTEKIVFKTINVDEAVQALQNGEIDSFDPSNPTGDMVKQLADLGAAAKVDKGQSFAFSHVDFDSRAKGVFHDIKVRQAFLKCVPRKELVDKFAKPIYAKSTVLDLREYLPAQAEYKEVLAGVPEAKKYADVDLPGAKALLADAGVKTPLKVRFIYSSSSTLRADQLALIKASCDQAGFSVQAKPDPDLFTTLTHPGEFDAAVFGWSGSGLIASGQSIYVTGGAQNYGGYSDKKVDDLWTEIVKTTDRAKVVPLKTEMEEELWVNPYNVVLYPNPGVTAFASSLKGPAYNPTQYGSTWNAETWTKTLD